MVKRKILTTALLAVFSAGATQAEPKVSNETRDTQANSIGYKEGADLDSDGWWNIGRGKRANVVKGDLKQCYYYCRTEYPAEVGGGSFDGTNPFFRTSTRGYTIHGDNTCQDRGYDNGDFREIDTGKTAKSFTLTLVPG